MMMKMTFTGIMSEVCDNYDSQFYYLDEVNETLDKVFYTYYAYVQNLNDDYSITLNGKAIALHN